MVYFDKILYALYFKASGMQNSDEVSPSNILAGRALLSENTHNSGPHGEFCSKFVYLLKSLLHQGLLEPEFYGDLVYKFKKIRDMTDFSDQFRKIIMRYKRIGYNLNVMRKSACLVINPITVDSYAALFNCTPVDRASDSMMAPT